MMDSGTNMPRLYLFLLRILQSFGSLTIIIIEILRHGTIDLIESRTDMGDNDYELFFEYCVMNLGFVTSALYIFRFNQRWKQGPYKYDILIDCVLMNAWMIFGILRLSPEFDHNNILNCSKYKPEQRNGCITYISTLMLGFFTSASYFFTAIVSTLLWTRKRSLKTNTNNTNTNSNSILNLINNNINNIDNTNNNCNSLSSKSSSNRTKLDETNNSQIANDCLQTITVTQGAEISLNEFITHNRHLAHLFNENLEFNRTDGSIVMFRKPSPCFLKQDPNTNSIKSSISQYSLDSSFSRTYGSIIIPRKYTAPSETDTITSSMLSRYDGSIIIGRNQSISSYSDNSTRLSSSLSEITSRSSRYDGSIIIKFVT